MSLGKMLDRAEQIAIDSTGATIQQAPADLPCAGCGLSVWECERGGGQARAMNDAGDVRCCAECFHREVMKAKPTMGYAPRPIDGGQGKVEIDQEWALAWQRLPRMQREAWRLYNRPRPDEGKMIEREQTIKVRELERFLDAGWEMTEQVDGGEWWKVTKTFWETPTHQDIGIQLGVSTSEARRLERAASKALPHRRRA